MRFAERLKHLRKELNLKQDDLAKACDVQLTTISKYENEIIKPAFEMLSKIGMSYNVNLNWLVNEIGSMFIETPKRRLIKTGTDNFEIEIADEKTTTVMEDSHSMELSHDLKVEYYGIENENYTKIYHKNGSVEYQQNESNSNNSQLLSDKIEEICKDKMKYEFIMTAINSIDNPEELKKLKVIIRGMELFQKD